MDNPDTLATLDTQDEGKQNTKVGNRSPGFQFDF